jgi:hypothetical protein
MAKNLIDTPYDDAGYPAMAAFTAGLTATGAVKTSPGRLLKVIVTTALGAGAVTVYDNASAASGTVLAVIPASSAVGLIQDINLPAVNGIYASFASTGGVTFGYA